ncbi:MAG: hypothetical protein V1728_03905 [Candidatus Micrarchaeota archaeon]
MQVTSKEAYKVVRAVLTEKKFKQIEISKKTKVTFSLVNRIIKWMVSLGYVGKRKGYYELISPGAIFNLFPLYRQLKPAASFNVELPPAEAMKMLEGKAALCLTSALSFYSDYYRDPAIYAYALDKKLLKDLKDLPEGKTRIEIYDEDLNGDDFVSEKGVRMTSKIRTVIDLYCSNKAYTAEWLVKREFA